VNVGAGRGPDHPASAPPLAPGSSPPPPLTSATPGRLRGTTLLQILRISSSRVQKGAEGPGFKSQPRRLGELLTLIVPPFSKQRNW